MTEEKSKQGKKNRKSGNDFEKKVREDLEKKGWTVDKWTNNVELFDLKTPERHLLKHLVPAKPEYNPFTKSLMMNKAGFPDFIAYRLDKMGDVLLIKGNKYNVGCGFKSSKKHTLIQDNNSYEIIGVEAKSNGILDKEEKEKCKWLLENNIFSRILIAHKEKEGRKIKVVYEEFKCD